jgi:glycosyltransferase involved in cell wall biosynthesis
MEMHHQGDDVLVVAPAMDEHVGLSIENDIKVLRVKSPKLMNVGIFAKGFANLLLPHLYKLAIKKSKIQFDFDFIILPTPPITLGILANWLKKRSNAKIYLILRDIFPQNAVDLKMLRPKGFFHSYFRMKEKKLYTISNGIGCMSQANIAYILKHNPTVDANKLHLLPNWQKMPDIQIDHINKDIKTKYGLQNKFVVIFGGNLGKPQKLENIVTLAKSLEYLEDVVFFIIGEGTEKKKLEASIISQKVTNIILKDRIPRDDYNELILLADVGLISLSEDFTIPNFPSKVLSYFASKIPVLASIDIHTDFGDMLTETNSGLWAEAGNNDQLKEKFLALYNDAELRKKLGKNGNSHMKKYLMPEHAYRNIFENI